MSISAINEITLQLITYIEHKVIWLGLDTCRCRVAFESLLESCRHSIQYQGKDNVHDTHGRTGGATSLFLSHGHNGGSSNNGGDLQIFTEGIGRSTQEEGSRHDGRHLSRLRKGRNGLYICCCVVVYLILIGLWEYVGDVHWVAAEAKVIDWIRFNGRSMLFSASIPPTSLAAASTSLDILIEEPWRVEQLHKNAKYWKDNLEKLGFTVGESQTPVIKVLVGDDLKCMVFCKELLEAGVYVNSAVYPAVPRNKASLRTSVMATHTKEHLDKALTIIAEVGRKLELIP